MGTTSQRPREDRTQNKCQSRLVHQLSVRALGFVVCHHHANRCGCQVRIWSSSTRADSGTRGFFDLGENREWECSVELYHKDLDNLVEYAENTRPDQNIGTNPDNNLVFWLWSSYGAELFVKRKFGTLNGWVGYTWSKTDRVFADLNNGDPFPAKFDRRHDLSVVVDWTPNDRWNFGAIFVYATGNALTLPAQRYFLEGLRPTCMDRETATASSPITEPI